MPFTHVNMVHASTRLRRSNDIIDAAIALVAERGLEGLTVAGLAKRVDYTPGALYRYFPSKDAILAAATARVIEELAERLAACAPGAAPLVRVGALCRTWLELGRTDPHRFGLLSLALADPRRLVSEELAEAPMAATVRALAPLVGALAEAEAAGLLAPGDPQQRAVLAFASVHGLSQLRKQQTRLPALFAVDALLAPMLTTLLVGWGAPPEAAARSWEEIP